MMENEVLVKTPEEAIETIKSNMPTSGYQMLRESLEMAITALKEIQQYREIGTVKECRTAMDYWKYLRERRCGLDAVVEKCMEYEKIGTVEECREAVEKQKPNPPTLEGDGYDEDGEMIYDTWICPSCGEDYEVGYDDYDFCPNCGQRILH